MFLTLKLGFLSVQSVRRAVAVSTIETAKATASLIFDGTKAQLALRLVLFQKRSY